ncbi:MAG: sulfite exporter TauE/SafE family protein [Deltaproteobacteria bacterium]|nr:sulfite exporter TauE/SafE family protein [Deltaproteobacteria bacterium]
MNLALIAVVSLAASCLSLFSGFGLGTILLPVFAVFIPVDMAVAATAMVHAANNVLKVVLVGRLADFKVVLKFGLPAIAAAYLGAILLVQLAHLPPWFSYHFLGLKAQITPLQFVLGLLILGFSMLELHPRLKKLSFQRKYLSIGGILSGFFGGLSGHQGALRSAFLAKVDMTARSFVGTNAVIGLIVDSIRLLTYGTMLSQFSFRALPSSPEGRMIITGSIAAFLGVVIGMKFLHKVTMTTIQYITGILLMVIGLVMTAGFI